MTMLIRAASLDGYAALASECGLNPVVLLRRVGLSPSKLQDPDNLIAFVAVINLLEISAAISACPDFGLRLGARQGFGKLGHLALLLRHAPSLQVGLELAARYAFVHNPAVQLQVEPLGGLTAQTALIAIEIDTTLPHLQFLELSLGILIKGISAVGQGGIQPQLTLFSHERLGPLSSYQTCLGCDTLFKRRVTGVQVTTVDLQRQLPTHNAKLQASAQQYIDQHFLAPGQLFTDCVRGMIGKFLSSGLHTQAHVARILSIHTRTLQRRLAAEGAYFEDLVDAERQAQLVALLKRPDAPSLAQISQLLGYSEPAVLTRSSHRWFGCTPTALKQRLTAA